MMLDANAQRASPNPKLTPRVNLPRLATLLLLSLTVAAPAAEFKAGAAAVNITPPLGTVINGGFRPIFAENVHDELHARAMALTDFFGGNANEQFESIWEYLRTFKK